MTTPAYTGQNTSFGLGKETTWGTAVARTLQARLISHSLRVIREKEPVNHLIDHSAINFRHFVPLRSRVEGDLEFFPYYTQKAFAALLQFAMHDDFSTSGSGPYAHDLVLGRDLPSTYAGLTVETSTRDFSEVFEGCLVNRFVLEQQANQMARCRVSLIGETAGARTTAVNPTLDASPAFLAGHQTGLLTFNSVDYTIKSFRFTIDNKLEFRPKLGALTTAEPVRNAIQDCLLEIELDKVSNALQAAYLADTQSDATLTWTSGAASIGFSLHNGLITEYEDSPSSVGPLVERLTLRGFNDGTKFGTSVSITNANSTPAFS